MSPFGFTIGDFYKEIYLFKVAIFSVDTMAFLPRIYVDLDNHVVMLLVDLPNEATIQLTNKDHVL